MPNYLYRFLRRRQPHAARAREIERAFERDQWLSPEEIQAVAWEKLKALLDHAYERAPFYRRRFDALGVTPRDIRTPDDFRRLPLLTKDDIRQHEDQLIAEGFSKAAMERAVTSGSTGEPFATYHGREYQAANVAAFARSRHWFGWEFGDKVAWFWGRRQEIPQTFTERLVYRIKQERWMDGFRPTSERMRAFAEELARWRPDLLAGYTNVIALFAQFVAEHHITGIRPKCVETTAMQLWPHQRALIEQVFQCPVSDRYGSHESGSVVAAECPAGRRHVFSDFCHVEILVDGRPAAPGDVGEVVTTPLYAYGMPLLRFRVGDVAMWDDTPCACGRGLPVLREIHGRVGSIFTLPSGRLMYGNAFYLAVFKETIAFKKIRVHQHSRDDIEILIERGPEFEEAKLDLVRQRVLKLLEGEPVKLTLTVTDEIPTTASGKHLVTTSDVPVRLT